MCDGKCIFPDVPFDKSVREMVKLLKEDLVRGHFLPFPNKYQVIIIRPSIGRTLRGPRSFGTYDEN